MPELKDSLQVKTVPLQIGRFKKGDRVSVPVNAFSERVDGIIVGIRLRSENLEAAVRLPIHNEGFAQWFPAGEIALPLRMSMKKTFELFDLYLTRVLTGKASSLFVSGMPGIGKDYELGIVLERLKLDRGFDFMEIKSKGSAFMLYQNAYNFRESGKTIIVNDVPSLMSGEGSSQMMSMLDTRKDRLVSWDTGVSMGSIPNSFYFQGGIIAFTNTPFIKLNNALLNRCQKLDMHFTRDEVMQRISEKSEGLMLDAEASATDFREVLDMCRVYANSIPYLSLRNFGIALSNFAAFHDDEATINCLLSSEKGV